jgi:hypothetical protein
MIIPAMKAIGNAKIRTATPAMAKSKQRFPTN